MERITLPLCQPTQSKEYHNVMKLPSSHRGFTLPSRNLHNPLANFCSDLTACNFTSLFIGDRLCLNMGTDSYVVALHVPLVALGFLGAVAKLVLHYLVLAFPRILPL